MQFQYNPSEIQISRQVEWASTVIPGRSHPLFQFINGGNRTVKFTLEMYKPNYGKGADLNTVYYVQNKLRFLEALTYPNYVGGALDKPPPVVGILFGHLFNYAAVMNPTSSWDASFANAKGQAFSGGQTLQNNLIKTSSFKGIITAMDIKAYYLFDPNTLLPQRADVEITVDEVLVDVQNRDNKVFRGIGGV